MLNKIFNILNICDIFDNTLSEQQGKGIDNGRTDEEDTIFFNLTSRLMAATASHLASRVKYAIVVIALYLIYIFDIKCDQNLANDISYTPKLKRTWRTKLTAKLDHNLNKLIDRMYSITKEWPSHKIKCKYNNTKVKQSLNHNKYKAHKPC